LVAASARRVSRRAFVEEWRRVSLTIYARIPGPGIRKTTSAETYAELHQEQKEEGRPDVNSRSAATYDQELPDIFNSVRVQFYIADTGAGAHWPNRVLRNGL
jgi:hypothetical protein